MVRKKFDGGVTAVLFLLSALITSNEIQISALFNLGKAKQEKVWDEDFALDCFFLAANLAFRPSKQVGDVLSMTVDQ